MDLDSLYDGAADLILQRGWRQGPRRNDDSVCLVEALLVVAGPDSTLVKPAFRQLFAQLRLIKRRRTTYGEALIRWNDHPETHMQNVVGELRRAAWNKERGFNA